MKTGALLLAVLVIFLQFPLSAQFHRGVPDAFFPLSAHGVKPLGIGYFGSGPAGGAYMSTPSFYAGVTVYRDVFMGATDNFTVQLNAVFSLLTESGRNFTYWVQDVAWINATPGSHQNITFMDNVWNVSAPYATVGNSSLSGRGTVYGGGLFYYYEAPGGSLPVSLPFSFNLTLISGYTGGFPSVRFGYSLGNVTVFYDTVRFLSAPGGRGTLFASGQRNGYGNYDDAELVVGGPGDYLSIRAVDMDIVMSLQYWDGNNYRAVTPAYDFGTDSGEDIYDANVSLVPSPFPEVRLTQGYESYYMVYGKNSASLVVAGAPAGSLLSLGSSSAVLPTCGNYTVESGIYRYYITYHGNTLGSGTVSISPGSVYYIFANVTVRVNLVPAGLPQGHAWNFSLDGANYTFTGNATLFLRAGRYSVAWSSPGFLAFPGTQEILLCGDVQLYLGFHRLYRVIFTGVPGAVVAVEGASPFGWSARIKAADGAPLYLPLGNYSYSAWFAGISIQRGRFSLNGNLTVHIDRLHLLYAFWPLVLAVVVSVSAALLKKFRKR